jgi:hypothetical protein
MTKIVGAFYDTPEIQCFGGIVGNIPFPFTNFQRSGVVGGKTTGMRERPTAMPREWVRKTAHLGSICAQIAFGTERKCSLAFAAQT